MSLTSHGLQWSWTESDCVYVQFQAEKKKHFTLYWLSKEIKCHQLNISSLTTCSLMCLRSHFLSIACIRLHYWRGIMWCFLCNTALSFLSLMCLFQHFSTHTYSYTDFTFTASHCILVLRPFWFFLQTLMAKARGCFLCLLLLITSLFLATWLK